MLGLSIGSLGVLSEAAAQMHGRRALGLTAPDMYPASDAYQPLLDAAEARAKAIAPNASPLLVGNQEYVPTPGEPLDTMAAASNFRAKTPDGKDASLIKINPNVDRSYYAHELGHSVAQKTKIGDYINQTRNKIAANPRLSRAVMTGIMFGTPAIATALQAGDDDTAGAIGLAAALASPTLIDEALASKNALAIMKDAGMPATFGQRGRLAGAYMSYLAPVLLAGGLGASLGNVIDDTTAIYDI